MKLFDIGQEATGVIAIGQHATGIVAVGQVAFGVVAVGQGAFGVLTFGQLSVGLCSMGMLSTGMFFSIAMIGVGGRGIGVVFPLAPSLGPNRGYPELRTVDEVRRGEPGWVAVDLVPSGPALRAGRAEVASLRFDARLRGVIDEMTGTSPVFAHIVPVGDELICDRLAERTPPRPLQRGWWGIWAVQTALLLPLGLLVWGVGIEPVIAAVLGN